MKMNRSMKFLDFKQGNNKFYISKIKINELLGIYEIDIYDEKKNVCGYQRPIQKSHRKKIVEYLIHESEPILNTPIIAAVDNRNLNVCNVELTISNKIRIVDGQHRTEAFRELKEKYPDLYNQKFENYEISIILIPISDSNLLEIETFININNKNKRVSTALAEVQMDRILKMKDPDIYSGVIKKDRLNNLSSEEGKKLIRSIANRVIININNDKGSIWYQKIKTGDSNNKNKIISINTFINASVDIVKNYIMNDNKDTLDIDSTINELTILLNKAWRIVEEKWKEATDIRYYNLLKGIGVCSISNILRDCIKEGKIDSIDEFEKIIISSHVLSEDWSIGGIFSPMNSRTGIKELELYIKNIKDIKNLR